MKSDTDTMRSVMFKKPEIDVLGTPPEAEVFKTGREEGRRTFMRFAAYVILAAIIAIYAGGYIDNIFMSTAFTTAVIIAAIVLLSTIKERSEWARDYPYNYDLKELVNRAEAISIYCKKVGAQGRKVTFHEVDAFRAFVDNEEQEIHDKQEQQLRESIYGKQNHLRDTL